MLAILLYKLWQLKYCKTQIIAYVMYNCNTYETKQSYDSDSYMWGYDIEERYTGNLKVICSLK